MSLTPTTHAGGGAKSLTDLEEVTRLSNGRVDLTIGSALDIFSGAGAWDDGECRMPKE